MASVGNIRETHHAERTATILAIGTSNPAHCVYQADSPDLYFRITNSEHLVELKEKYKRICEKTKIKKRYTFLTEETAKAHPNVFTYKAPSYDTRQDLLIPEVPKLGHEAALKAIKEWGQPVSRITHLVVSTSSGIDMPGADFQLTKLLGLNLTTKRYMIYQQGCFSGAAALRLAKDLAENNTDSRVLVVCSELLSAMFFHAPSNHLDDLLGAAIFGDGAASVIIGANPDIRTENPLFKLEFTTQLIIPNSDGAMGGHLREMGATYYIKPSVPYLFGSNVEKSVAEAFSSIGISDWNSLFYIVHPGGPVILDLVEKKLKLKKDKLGASWEVLREYGNMGGPSVIFALDEMRKKSMEEGKATTGDGMEWGVLIGLGPGITMEIIVLRSVPTITTH